MVRSEKASRLTLVGVRREALLLCGYWQEGKKLPFCCRASGKIAVTETQVGGKRDCHIKEKSERREAP